MKANRLLSALLAVGLGLVTVTQATESFGGPTKGKGKKEAAEEALAEPSPVQKAIPLPLMGLSWGQSPKTVADAMDKVLDEDYRPQYQKVQPGVKMKILDAQLAEDKNSFRRSRIDFGKLPTGFDSSPLRGEYTYQNREALMSLTRKGVVTHFFFIQEKLWKIIEEYKLNAASPLGKTYQDGVGKLATTFGVVGRVVVADATHPSMEVDWKDSATHVRAIHRSDTTLGLAYEDSATVANLGTLRPNKPADDNGIDPDVAAAVMKGKDPAPPPPAAPPPKKSKQ